MNLHATIDSLQKEATTLRARLDEALAFVRDNEWGGRVLESGELVPCCLDCGALKGQPHSPTTCRWLSVTQGSP